MKKSTKKKIKKAVSYSLKGILKLIIVYPAKGLWKLGKLIINKIKKSPDSSVGKKTAKGKVKAEAGYEKLDVVKQIKGNLAPFEKKLYSSKSTIGLILGARGSGKSAIGMRLLENFKVKSKKKIYALGFKAESLPKWITVVSKVEDIENGSVILVDEGGIEFSSRKSMSDANTVLSDLLLIARHKDLSVMFITQNSANLEINVIRQADYLLLKPSSLLQKDFERKKIKDIYVSAASGFEEFKETVGLMYIYADSFQGFVTNGLPGFWSDKVSKGYSNK